MRFLTFLKADKNTEANVMPSEKLLADMGQLMEDMAKAGILLGAEGLQPSSKSSRVFYTGGKATVMDGPFAEAKELVAGYCLMNVKSKEEAVEWATRCLKIHVEGTGIGSGQIEIRPLFEAEDFGQSEAVAREVELRKELGWQKSESFIRRDNRAGS